MHSNYIKKLIDLKVIFIENVMHAILTFLLYAAECEPLIYMINLSQQHPLQAVIAGLDLSCFLLASASFI